MEEQKALTPEEKTRQLIEWSKKKENIGCLVPDHLRPDSFYPKVECRYCECGYIIPEPTPEELKMKAQQDKIEEQSQAINTLTESMKFLTEHLSKLTNAFNDIVKEK
jgi:hypothetical protein